MTTRRPLKYGCCATIESDEIDQPPPPTKPEHDSRYCLCATCRETATRAEAR